MSIDTTLPADTPTTNPPKTTPTPPPSKQVDNISAFVIPPIPTLDLPPLPHIADASIRDLVFTHSSKHGAIRRPNELIFDEKNKILDNEKLEFVGDSLLGLAVTLLLEKLYPAFGPGPSTYMKGRLVSNETLAQLCDQYSLCERFIAHKSAKLGLSLAVKARGSLFEAYIGGVYYSYLKHGPERLTRSEAARKKCDAVQAQNVEGEATEEAANAGGIDSISALAEQFGDQAFLVNEAAYQKPIALESGTGDDGSKYTGVSAQVITPGQQGQTSSTKPAAEPQLTVLPTPAGSLVPLPPGTTYTHGQAFDHICAWLFSLYTPLTAFVLEILETETFKLVPVRKVFARPDPPAEWAREDDESMGASAVLNTYTMKHFGSTPKYDSDSPEDYQWRTECQVKDREGTVFKTEATRYTKKQAQAVAAFRMCELLGLFKKRE